MVEPIAQIRAFKASDDKLVRFAIGKANMESLAVANRKGYMHPLTIGTWLGLSSIFIEFMQWWPTNRHGLFGYFTPIPALAAMAVPIMFLIDWLNRPYFEQHVQDALRSPDIPDISGYYSRSPSSGFWMLEYGDRFVGLVALDASHDSMSNESVLSATGTNESRKKAANGKRKGTAATATIRHFYVDEAYRGSGIQIDLLNHAIQYAFSADHALQHIRAPDSPLIPYIRICLREVGFHLDQNTQKVGVFGWKLGMRILGRADWERQANHTGT